MSLSRRHRSIKVATLVVGLRLYTIVTDIMAGKRNRYTVYRTLLTQDKRPTIVGRELPLGHAKRVISDLEKV